MVNSTKTESIHVDTTVIGAGVIGLAIASSLAENGFEVLLIEKESSIGNGISSRNSGVIHAGIYYPSNSLKARYCLSGKNKLYKFCEEYSVDHKAVGKLILATNDGQIEQLKKIEKQAYLNGLRDLVWLNKQAISAKESELNATAALYSPSTGVIDSQGLMLALQSKLEKNGGQVVLASEVVGGCTGSKKHHESTVSHELHIKSSPNSHLENQTILTTNKVINCSGLYSSDILKGINNFPSEWIPKIYYAKGSYYSLTGLCPFSHLIYPIPEQAGLGIHLTLDLIGKAKFGPDVEWLPDALPDQLSYRLDQTNESMFYSAIRNYWPNIPQNSLAPDYSGIRPKLVSQGEPAADFRIDHWQKHGIDNWINLHGIESPGLTASLAIAEAILNLHTN